MKTQYRPQVAEVRAIAPDPSTDWVTEWKGSAYNLDKIHAAVTRIEGNNHRAVIVIPENNMIYRPSQYARVLWVRIGVEYLQRLGVYAVNGSDSR